jgi:hypothetical protein
MAGPRIVVALRTPITHGDEIITEIVMTEPTLGGLMEGDNATGNMAKVVATICACSGLPPSVVKQLRARDVKAIEEAAETIMGEEFPVTGETTALGSPIPFTGVRKPSNG